MQTVLYDYQETTSNDIFKRISTGEIKGAYLGFDTGCVCGNNSVTVKLNGTGPSQVMTMKNLYTRWKNGDKFTIKSMVNGRFQFMPIKDVVYSGMKECLTIYTDKDRIQHGAKRHLSCTYDHPIYCEQGFKQAQEFKIGDTIFSNGQLVCSYCGKKLSQTPWRKYNKYPDLCRSCSCHMSSKEAKTGYYEYTDKDGYRWVVDDTLRDSYSEYKDYLKCKEQNNFFRRGIAKHRLVMMQHLGRELTEEEVVHHIDGNKMNNDISNLQLMTPSEHAKWHSHVFTDHLIQNNDNIESIVTKNGKHYYFTPQLAKITKIKYIGIKPVYDVSIDHDDIHNFICSDKVVHNTGKTVTSLSVAEKLFNEHIITSVVVICPVSKVDDWKNDLKKETPEIKNTFVSSFQSAWREKNSKLIQEQLRYGCLLIVDEGHKMKTYDSKQSKYIQALASRFNIYVLVLSATPQNKKYIDLYPQYKILNSSVFNIKAKDFKDRYCIEEANFNMVYAGRARFPYNEIVGYKHTDEMDAEIKKYTYYKKYESEYDRPIEIKQFFKMTSDMRYFKEKKVWPKMDEKALETLLASGDIEDIDIEFIIANRPALHHIYKRESCSGFIKDKILKDNPKLQWLEDFLDGNEGRIVVFTNFVNETILIENLCKKMKRPCCIYDGSHKDLAEWNMYENCIAIVNVVAGGAGINDFIKTNIAIFFSPPENYIDFEQAKGRIDRIGQTKQPVYYYLQVAGNVEPDIYKALYEGRDFDLRLYLATLEKEGDK